VYRHGVSATGIVEVVVIGARGLGFAAVRRTAEPATDE
jgi:hypothetical protein